jgi:hypothetical protein
MMAARIGNVQMLAQLLNKNAKINMVDVSK